VVNTRGSPSRNSIRTARCVAAAEPSSRVATSSPGSWTVLATFGSETEAAERIDEELGLGHGGPADYRIRPVGMASWKRWVGIGVLVLLAATSAFMLVLFWFDR
jgi:hypothetical protein